MEFARNCFFKKQKKKDTKKKKSKTEQNWICVEGASNPMRKSNTWKWIYKLRVVHSSEHKLESFFLPIHFEMDFRVKLLLPFSFFPFFWGGCSHQWCVDCFT